MAHSLEQINWQAPWLSPWRQVGEPVAHRVLDGHSVAEALNCAIPSAMREKLPIRFVPQSDLPDGEAYEHYIFRTATVPTRNGVHDFFNGLCWHHFAQTKRRLNELQASQIAVEGIRPIRGALRDALTLLDENGALLIGSADLYEALRERDWQRAFVHDRAMWQEATIILFGHALLEKLIYPRKTMTAHVYCPQTLPTTMNSLQQLDQWLALALIPICFQYYRSYN